MLQQSAAIIANWSIDNGMRIKEMIISFCRDPVFLPYINIERVSQVKVLGVTLSSDRAGTRMLMELRQRPESGCF